MAIEYVEIRDENTDMIGIIDTANSIIWRSTYFGVGDFEIYVQASPAIVALLQPGYFVTRPDDLEVGIIEGIAVEDDPQDGTMLTATGRFAKSILDRRIIYNLSETVNKPTILKGNVETEVRRVVTENAINCAFNSKRNIPLLALGALAGIQQQIVDGDGKPTQKQVTSKNLLTYTDELLQEYGLAATVILDAEARKLRYVIYAGVDRSKDNVAGNDPIIFSKEFDNLTGSSYKYSETSVKNVALIGGAGEDAERFHSVVAGSHSGLQRREMFVDASSINRKYTDENDTEQSYSNADYRAMLNAEGTQTLATHIAEESFDGTIDIMNSRWVYNRDFSLGDIVTTENTDIGKYVNTRLFGVLEVQDENGYSIEAINQT